MYLKACSAGQSLFRPSLWLWLVKADLMCKYKLNWFKYPKPLSIDLAFLACFHYIKHPKDPNFSPSLSNKYTVVNLLLIETGTQINEYTWIHST